MFRPRWRKVLADLWGNKTRTLLVVASIAVGVFAIGVIAGTYVMLKADLNLSYSSSNPANIALMTTPLSDDVVDIIRRMDEVADAEAYTTASLRLQTRLDSWKTLKLYAFSNYEERTIHRLLSPVGATIPGDHEIILEHKTLASLGASIGDTLDVELPDGTRRQLTIVGTGVDQSEIYDIILGDLRGYITVDTLEWLHQPTYLNQLYVTVAESPNDKAHIQQVATAVTDRLEQAGLSIFRTETALQNKHPLDSIIQALIAVLIILGVLIAFLSGSLIANTMSALLSQHLRQIGIMKLVGARRVQITAMYFVLIMSFGLVALVLSVPTASAAAYALLGFIANIVNFVVQDFRVVPQAIIVQIIIGLIVPPAAGILPVITGSRITVQKAISSTGISAAQQKKGWLDRQLERLKVLSRPMLISIRNTFRRKGRLALTLFTLTLGGAVFIAVFNSQVSLDTKMEQVTRYFGADVQLDFVNSYRVEKITNQALTVPGVERVEVWLTTGADWLHAPPFFPPGGGDSGKEAPPSSIGIIAPPADSDLIDPTLLEGRWLLPGDQNAIAVNEAFWNEAPDLKPGDTLRLKLAGREEDWTVVGIFQYTGFDDLVAYANYDYVADVLQQTRHASSYRIVTTEHDLAFQEKISAQLNAHFRDLGLEVSKAEAGKAFNASVTDVLGILTAVLLVMALMTALVGSIGLTGTMSMNVMERTREIGVMRAIGAHNQIVSKLVIVEGLVIGLMSYGMGSVLSFPISMLLSNVISLAIFNTPAPFAFTAQGFLIWLIVVIFLSMAASLLPARNASKLTIREVLAYE